MPSKISNTIDQTTETVSDQTSETSRSEKDVAAERVDRRALIRSSFTNLGEMHIDPKTIGKGFRPQWAHDEFGGIERYIQLGYTYATDPDGQKISKVVFRSGDKKGLKAFLLKVPESIAQEIDDIRAEQNEAPLLELERKYDPAFPTLGLKRN